MKKNYTPTNSKTRGLVSCLLFLVLITQSTYSQQTYTFTNCGATSSIGPTQSQVTSAYNLTNLSGNVSVTPTGIQTWTVPTTGLYRITANGASSGMSTNSPNNTIGKGASIQGDFNLTAGDVLQILVGQKGPDFTYAAGGGGGSFVTKTPHNTLASILVIAGGGGSPSADDNGVSASTSTCGNFGTNSGPSTCGGNGGLSFTGNSGGGGGGFFTNGDGTNISGNTYGVGGNAYVNGGTGAAANTLQGGFGGGGGHNPSGTTACGHGGGGFSGGNGGNRSLARQGGGGGGSYNNGSNQLSSVLTNTGNGTVIIAELCNIRIISSTTGTVNPAVLCSGNSLTLTTTAVSGYSWSTGATTSSIVVAPTTNTVYSLTGTSSLACIASTNMSVVVSSGLPVLSISNPSNNICLGRTATLTATGAVNYTWTGGVTNGQTFTPTATSNYTVTGINGCGAGTATTSIIVAPLPVSVAANPTIVCQGYPSVLSASSAVSGYTWQPLSIPGQSITVSPTVNTVYTVTASDGTCSGVATLTLNTKVTPTVTATGSSSVVCENGTLSLSASGAINYSWTPANMSGQNIIVTPTISALYQVGGTNSVGCTGYASWVVLVNPAPPTTASTNKAAVCIGAPAILTGGGASSYNWAGGPPTSGYTVNPQVATTYTVTGTGSNGCTKDATVSVAVYNPTLTITSSAPGFCPGGNVTLSASTPGATTYSWNGTVGPAALVVSPASTSIYTANANSTSSALQIICPVSNTIQVVLYALPTITITATKSQLCKNEPPAILTVAGASTYVWTNNSATTTTINSSVVSTLTYSVTGTDANGCEGTASFKVTVNPCVGIAEAQKMNEGISVYPNPNNGEFIISSTADVNLSIINELGQEIKLINLNSQNNRQLNLSGLPAGIYFIVGQNGDSTINHKIVITK